MKILGVDPGLRATGYGLIELEKQKTHRVRLITVGTIKPKQNDSIPNRVQKVYHDLSKIIKSHQPDCMVLEKLYAHYKHPATAFVLGHVRGVICLLCAEHQIKLVEHSVKRIRKTLLGNGNASKEQTQHIVAHILNIDVKQLTLDASDALALSLGCAQMLTFKMTELAGR